MKVQFRVRAPQWGDEVSPEELEKRDRYYRQEFLAAKRENMDRALWKHFFHDSFHDGEISDMQFEPVHSRLTFNLSCPNVKFHHGEGFQFVNVDYQVVMHRVECLSIQRREGEPSLGVSGATFGYAEIDTCEEEIVEVERRTGDPFHSLIIEADLLHLLVVFGYIHVEAREPVATELLRRDPRYEFPFVEW